MDYGYKLTTNGRRLLAALWALGQPLKLTRVEVGDGTVPEGVSLADLRQLVHPVAEGAVGDCRHENDRLYLTVQYSNQGKTDVKTFCLSEFIVYAADPETGKETDLIYGAMGDYRQPVPAYSPSLPASVWSFTMVVVVSDEIEVAISAPAGLVVWDDMRELINGLAARRVDLTIPADGWTRTGTGTYPYRRDIPMETVTEVMIPRLTVLEAGEATALACGLSGRAETLEGVVRVSAVSVPSAPIPASLALHGDASGFVLSSGDEGGVSDHRRLTNRNAENQHPISSISGLEQELGRISNPVKALTNAELEELLTGGLTEKTACLVIPLGDGTEQRTDLKLIPHILQVSDYLLDYSGVIPFNAVGYLRLEPPAGYAFTGLASSWQPALKIDTVYRSGTLNADGSISFEISSSDLSQQFTFVSMDTNESPAWLILELA